VTITEKYILQVVPYLAVAEGAKVEIKQKNGGNAYLFPCPFCSRLTTSSGKKKPNKQTAIISPRYETKWVYYFKCHRGGDSRCAGAAKSFQNFLETYDPDLFNKYLREMDVVTKKYGKKKSKLRCHSSKV
jgi:hypothetical protein